MFNFEFLIREGIAHAKGAKAAKPRQECGAGPDASRGADAEREGLQEVKGESFCGKWGEGFGGRALFQ